MDNLRAGGEQCVHCREVVHSSECPLSEVPLYHAHSVHATWLPLRDMHYAPCEGGRLACMQHLEVVE